MGAEPLHAGLALLRQGRVEAACVALGDAVRAQVDNADAWHLLGLAVARRDGPSAGIDPVARAVTLDPDHGPAWHNLGRFLRATGTLDRAEQAFLRAGALLEGRPDPWIELAQIGVARLDQGDAAGAARALAQARARLADAADVAVLLGRALRELGDLSEALRAVDGIDHPAAHALRGSIAERLGDLAGAVQGFELAVGAAPDDGASWHNLARVLRRSGALDRALAAHARALELSPQDRARWIGCVDTIAAHPDPPAAIEPLLVRALQVEGLGHQGLERAIRCCVERALGALPWPDAPDDLLGWGAIVAALDRPLVYGWLRRTRVVGPIWEGRLAALRAADLRAGILDHHLDLRVSLAIQAHHTGHAWSSRAADLDRARALCDLDPGALARKAAWPVGIDEGAAWGADPRLGPLREVAVDQRAVERELAGAIPELATAARVPIEPRAAETSEAVRDQYEEHPYPRLISVHLKPPAPLPAVLAQILPTVSDLPDPRPLRILIAGCGTGQQIVAAATRYAEARILALDLSRASLGVAARQLRERGLDAQVQLARGDLLALSPELGSFDLVECGGVLHHLAEPIAGLRALLRVLAPQGLLKLGVYSERARADVVAAQAVLREHRVGTSSEELRRGRQILRDLAPDHPAASVVWSPDFASLAGFRDLVLHACEHRYTLERLGVELEAVGLELLGFQHPDPRPPALYARAFPEDRAQRDLDRWTAIEREHPECFRGMYQVWCRRAQASMS